MKEGADSRRLAAITAGLLLAMAAPVVHLCWLSFEFAAAPVSDRESIAESFSGFLATSYPGWAVAWIVLATVWWNRPLALRGKFAWLLGIPMLFFVLAAISPPMLSDDVYRYLWEGRVLLAGYNPYAVAPDALVLEPLAEEYSHVHRLINHPELPAIYPPLAQYVFAAVAGVVMHPAAIKLVMVFIGVLCVFCFHRFLVHRDLPTGRVVAFASHPLLVMEAGFGGHLDVLVMLGALLLFLGVSDSPSKVNKLYLTISGLSIAVLAKLAPVLLLPHAMKSFESRRAAAFAGAGTLFIVFLFYLPFIGAGESLFRSLGTYNKFWEFNGMFYPLLVKGWFAVDADGELVNGLVNSIGGFLGFEGLSARLRSAEGFGMTHPAQLMARVTGVIGFACVWFFVLWRVKRIEYCWLYVVGAGLLLSPVVHPWYLLALLPVCFLGGGISKAVLWWSLSIPFTYAVLPRWWTEGEWVLPGWVWWVQYAGMLLVLVAGILYPRIARINANH